MAGETVVARQMNAEESPEASTIMKNRRGNLRPILYLLFSKSFIFVITVFFNGGRIDQLTS
jgi:hypothetical protein